MSRQNGFTWARLDRLRRALRSAVDESGIVLDHGYFRQLARIIARIDEAADSIADDHVRQAEAAK